MNTLPLKAAFFAASLLIAASVSAGYVSTAQSGLLTFDDLGTTTAPIVNGYQGLDWSNFNYVNAPWATATYGTNGFSTVANADTPPNVATNAGGGTAAFWTANLANFRAIDFGIGSVWQDHLGITLAGYEYDGSTLGPVLHTLTLDLANPFTVYHEAINWTDVNYIAFTVSTPGTQDSLVTYNGGTQFAIDELTEPNSFTLLLLGVPIIAASSRSKFRPYA